MRNVCLSHFGRALLFSGVLLLSGMVAPAMAEDETQACNVDGQAFAYGDVLAGCLIDVADLDIFTFQASAGENVTIVLSRTGGSNFSAPCFELYDPNNVQILNCSDGRVDTGPLPVSGTYRIVVTEQGNNGIVQFNMSLERISPLRSPTPVGSGDLVVGRQIFPVSDLDTFSFNANAGDLYRLILTRTGGSNFSVPCLEIRRPDFGVFVGLTCGGGDLALPAAPMTGTYQVIVTAQGNNALVTFSLGLNCISATCASRPPTCLANPSFAANTLTMDFVVGTPDPTEWHLAVLALGRSFTLWKIQLPVIDPAVTASVPIVGFPAIGTVALLSTFTDESGLVCTDLKTVDTGPMSTAVTPSLLQQYLQQGR